MPTPAYPRYALLIRRLRRVGQATLSELTDYVRRELPDTLPGYSRRTFQRDLEAIAELFGIEITCARRTNTYAITADNRDALAVQLLEALEVKHFLAEAAALALAPLVQLEPRHPAGTEWLRPLLTAARGRRVVHFRHQKHWEDAPTTRTVWPLGLRQSAGRWYLLAFDQTRAGAFRTFGLDRISELTETATPFPKQDFDAATYFRDTYGVTRPDDGTPPADLLLAFDWQQGRYVEDYPLHPSQQTVSASRDDDEIRISLRVFWTHEVLMALLTYGPDVAVLEPAEACAAVAAAHQLAANLAAE